MGPGEMESVPKNRVSKATVDFGRICSTEREWEARLQWVECNAT